jgi:hypothetical protein
MDLSQMGNIRIFQLPIDISPLTTIRQQLWASIDRSPDIHNLMAANLVQCKRIDRQPLTYLSALPHQLLKGNTGSIPYSSSQILGHHLLESLAASHHDEPTTQWQGAASDQGYLYLQPSDEAIAACLNQLLNIKKTLSNSGFSALSSDAPITLQYTYIRCNQMLQTITTEISSTEFTARISHEMELIGAILDIWDDILADFDSTNASTHRIFSLAQQLVEKFLEFEKYCCVSAKSSQTPKNFNFSLVAIVQKTVKIILHQYWGIEPPQHW